MKKLYSIFLTVMLLASVGTIYAGDKTIEGELVDITCYVKGASGSSHQACAIVCAKLGKPVGIVAKDGKIYTLQLASSDVADYMAKTVKVTGTIHEASQSIQPLNLEVFNDNKWVKIETSKSM